MLKCKRVGKGYTYIFLSWFGCFLWLTGMLHVKIWTKKVVIIQVEPPSELPKRTLMDIQRMETFSPQIKCPEYEDLSNQLCTNDLLKITKKMGILFWMIASLLYFKKMSIGIRCTNLQHHEHLWKNICSIFQLMSKNFNQKKKLI